MAALASSRTQPDLMEAADQMTMTTRAVVNWEGISCS